MLFGLILIVALLRWPNGLLTWVRLKPPARPAAAGEAARAAPGHGRPAPERGRRAQALRRAAGAQDVTLDIPPGRITGLIGPNGAGKSTLFNVMTAVLPASGGQVSLDGAALPARAHEVVRRGVARSFQHVQLVPELTVLDNVLIGGHIRARPGCCRPRWAWTGPRNGAWRARRAPRWSWSAWRTRRCARPPA